MNCKIRIYIVFALKKTKIKNVFEKFVGKIFLLSTGENVLSQYEI